MRPMVGDTPAPDDDDGTQPARDVVSALPPAGARILAFASIIVAGACGGLIGWAVADLQCHGDCAAVAGVAALVGALFGAGGVAVVAVLVLRAMGEWRTIQHTGDPTAGRRARRRS
jgi:hypothetical protein